jgi:hypothetical protein
MFAFVPDSDFVDQLKAAESSLAPFVAYPRQSHYDSILKTSQSRLQLLNEVVTIQ